MNCKLGLFALFFSSLLWQTEVEGMAGTGMEKEPDVVLRKQDSGTEITVKAGQVIPVQLARVGGTGYWWYAQNPDGRYFFPLPEETRTVSDGRVGGPVLGLWTFRAKEKGTSEIKMDYYPRWEGSDRAIALFIVKIRIESDTCSRESRRLGILAHLKKMDHLQILVNV